MSDIGAVVTALATIALVIVTWKYAQTTKKMSQTAGTAAEHARAAAEASRQAAAAARAEVRVAFTTTPRVHMNTVTQVMSGIDLRCDGATVYVHGCVLEEYTVRDSRSGFESVYDRRTAPAQVPTPLIISDPDDPVRMPLGSGHPRAVPGLPVRLEQFDEVFFEVPPEVLIPNAEFGRAVATVSYSLEPDGNVYERKGYWRAPRGRAPRGPAPA